MRGAKWMREASYLTDADRVHIMSVVHRAQDWCRRTSQQPSEKHVLYGDGFYNPRLVGVRPSSYTGEDSAIAVVTYGPGGCSIYEIVRRY